jgi:hypothetical protein
MAQTVIVQLTDDIDGGEAVETIGFALNGKTYEIDVNAENARRLREAFAPFIEKARKTGLGDSSSRTRPSDKLSGTSSKTLFSGLEAEEKDRFRAWAKMPTARRVSDTKVQEWIDDGRP